MRIAVTGRPGIGKTTFCLRVYEKLGNACGFVTVEVREKGRRTGFKLKDLRTGREAWLAKVGFPGPSVGKYGVDVKAIEDFILRLDANCDVVIVDEAGPMELKCPTFTKFVEKILQSNVCCLFTIHLKARHPLLERIRKEFMVIELDESNRDSLVDKIAGMLNACSGR